MLKHFHDDQSCFASSDFWSRPPWVSGSGAPYKHLPSHTQCLGGRTFLFQSVSNLFISSPPPYGAEYTTERRGSNLSVLVDNPPSPGEVGHTTGVYVPYSFRTVVYVLLCPTRTREVKVLWDGTYVFHPHPRRLESLTVCRCHCKGSTFSTVTKTLSVGLVARVWTRALPLSRPALSQLS